MQTNDPKLGCANRTLPNLWLSICGCSACLGTFRFLRYLHRRTAFAVVVRVAACSGVRFSANLLLYCLARRALRACGSRMTALISSATELLRILAAPESSGLVPGAWYALTATNALVAASTEHTLAGQLGLSPDQLNVLARDAELWGGVGLSWPSLPRRLRAERDRLQLVQMSISVVAEDGIRWFSYRKKPDEVLFVAASICIKYPA